MFRARIIKITFTHQQKNCTLRKDIKTQNKAKQKTENKKQKHTNGY